MAITDTSVTAVSSDGSIGTYRITPLTTVVSVGPTKDGGASAEFSVSELVSIAAAVDDGALTATVVVDQALANGNGPPMDG